VAHVYEPIRLSRESVPSQTFPALSHGATWNGWETPIVGKAALDQMLTVSGKPYTWDGDVALIANNGGDLERFGSGKDGRTTWASSAGPSSGSFLTARMTTLRLLSATGAVRTSRSSWQPTAHLLSVGETIVGVPEHIQNCGFYSVAASKCSIRRSSRSLSRSSGRRRGSRFTMSRAQSGAGLGGPRPCSFSRGPGTLVA
jgi:hypothetical protein